MTEHATHQIKEFARRFDGKKYIINEDNNAEYGHKKFHEQIPGAITDEEWKLSEDDDERQQTIYSQNSTNENEGPIEYMNQKIEFENMKKVGCTYVSDNKMKTHAFIFTFRMEKRMDETQVT